MLRKALLDLHGVLGLLGEARRIGSHLGHERGLSTQLDGNGLMMHLSMGMGEGGLLLNGDCGPVMHRLHGNGDRDAGHRTRGMRDLDGMLRMVLLDGRMGLLARIVPRFPRVRGCRLSLRPRPRDVIISLIPGDAIEILLGMRAYLCGRTSTDIACNLCPVTLEELEPLEHTVMLGGTPHLADLGGGVRLARPWGRGV